MNHRQYKQVDNKIGQLTEALRTLDYLLQEQIEIKGSCTWVDPVTGATHRKHWDDVYKKADATAKSIIARRDSFLWSKQKLIEEAAEFEREMKVRNPKYL
jgi:hypothetical protein